MHRLILMTIHGFTTSRILTGDTEIFVCAAGAGSPLLLLHGFPQTHLMWRRVAPLLVEQFTIVCADLRGYGRSGCPASAPGHSPYSKRVLAGDMVLVMEQLGFSLVCSTPRFLMGRSWTEVGLKFSTRNPGRIRFSVPAKVVRTCHKPNPSSVLVS